MVGSTRARRDTLCTVTNRGLLALLSTQAALLRAVYEYTTPQLPSRSASNLLSIIPSFTVLLTLPPRTASDPEKGRGEFAQTSTPLF